MSFQRTPPHKYPATHLIFVKNVPQESCSSVASLYTQYRPLRIKNLYPSSQITTLMIALPTADIAASALHRTDGLKFDNMVLSVERYNAKQSTVARRDTRRLRDGGADAGDERFGADEREEDEVPEGWEDEGKTLVDDEAVVEPKAGNVRVVSWADVTRGRNVVSGLAGASAMHIPIPMVSTPQTHLRTLGTFSLIWGGPERGDYPDVVVTPPTLRLTPLDQLQTLLLAGTDATEGSDTAPQDLTSRNSEVEQVGDDRSQATQDPSVSQERYPSEHLQQLLLPSTIMTEEFDAAPQELTSSRNSEIEPGDDDRSQETHNPDVPQEQHEPLSWPTDTTAYIRGRHCADCAFCKRRMQG